VNIFQTIKRETEGFCNKTAVIDGDIEITYENLIVSAEAFASELERKGVKPFHRVAFLCNDSVDYIIASLAVLSLSAVVVPISPKYSVEERENIIESIKVNFLVFEEGLNEHKKASPLNAKGEKRLYFKEISFGEENLCKEYFEINPAFIRFSSGTTGASKGVILSHKSIIERTDAADKGLNITPDDTIIWVLSMSFHFVVTILLFLRRAATIILCTRSFPESLIEAMTRHKGTFIYASPFHYDMISSTDILSKEHLKVVRLAVSTAMKLPGDVADMFFSKFGFELTEAYGIIEVGLPFINLPPHKKQTTVGKALPDYEVKIFNIENDIGEVHIRGKGMLDAYFVPWQSRRDVLTDGWFNTGDLGRVDEDGYLTILGRKKNVINFVGMKIFPYEVESVIKSHPLVKESLVYGVNHPRYGQLPMAKVVPKEGLEVEALRKFCYERLSQYSVPKCFELVEQLNMTASGKVKL